MYLVSPMRALLMRPGSLVTAMPLTRSLSPEVELLAMAILIWHLGAAVGWMPSMKVTSWLYVRLPSRYLSGHSQPLPQLQEQAAQ